MILNTSFCDSLPLSQFRATAAMGVIWSRNTSTKSFVCGFSSKVKGSEQMNHKSAYVFSQRAEEVAVEDEVAVMPETAPSLKSIPGLPNPLGVSEIDNGINFALFSQHATSVTLCLSLPDREIDASPNDGMIELKLDPCANKTGDIWHICVQELPRTNVIYGYKIDGPQNWHQGHRFDNSVVLIDPYAKILEGRRIFGNSTEKFSKLYGTYDFSSLPFDWGDNYAQPNIPEKDLVIYEMNVRAFTADKSSRLEQTIRGSYRGVIDKIPHLLELGVNAMELLPVFEFDEFEFQRRPNPRDHMVIRPSDKDDMTADVTVTLTMLLFYDMMSESQVSLKITP